MMSKEEKNRMAVRAMAVAMFNAPVREGETHEDAMDAIVKKMEGQWPSAIGVVDGNQDPPLGIGQRHTPKHTLAGEPVETKVEPID